MSEARENEKGPFTGSKNNSTDPNDTTPIAKNMRFGFVELGIFFLFWIIMIWGYRTYYIYSQRKKRSSASWFGSSNAEFKAYQELLEKDPNNTDALKKALVRRAMADVRRLMSIQDERDSIMSLSRSGAISEEMLGEFKAAEKELEMELFEVQSEAETFKEGWSQEIIKDAARLNHIERELAEVKRRKEKEENQRKEDAARAEREKITKERAAFVGEDEKDAILKELLEHQNSESEKESSLKRRVVSPAGKK